MTKVGESLVKIMEISKAVPLQKWFYLTINVDDKRVEAYINGKLVKTVYANQLMSDNMNDDFVIGSTTLSGYLTKFYRLPYKLDPLTIQNNYLSGNGLSNWISSIFPYGMNFTITNVDSAVRVVKVF
jgi:hypothetical protein